MIPITPEIALYVVWSVWAISWLIAAVWSSRAQNRIGFGSEALYRILTVSGFVLLFLTGPNIDGGRTHFLRLPIGGGWIHPLWDLQEAVGWAMVALGAAGFLFAWWARIHLGALWSGSITRKANHRIVDTGPYGIVRHPIYTGLLAAAIAMGAVKATPVAFAGVALMAFGYWLKARMEEGFLRSELGPEDYDAYKKRVPMLVPFLGV